LEIYEIDDVSKDKLEEICDLRQPVLFDFNNEKIIQTTNSRFILENYPAFEMKIRNINETDSNSELYVNLPLHASDKLFREDKNSAYFSENNSYISMNFDPKNNNPVLIIKDLQNDKSKIEISELIKQNVLYKPFNLNYDCLNRFVLIRNEKNKAILVICFHHIIILFQVKFLVSILHNIISTWQRDTVQAPTFTVKRQAGCRGLASGWLKYALVSIPP
jgi:hypothetical protein